MATLETTFCTLYQPLFLLGYEKPVATVFGSKRTAQVPKFEIWKLNQDVIGSVTVNTPPPFSALVKPKVIPTPKGKMALVITPLSEQSLVNKSIEYEIVTRYSSDFAGKKRARAQAEGDASEEGTKEAKDEGKPESAAIDDTTIVVKKEVDKVDSTLDK